MEDQDYILFENYLSGTLSDTEAAAMENRLESDAEFNKAFDTYKELSDFLGNKVKDEAKTLAFKDNLKSISDNYFNTVNETKTTGQKTMRFKPWQYSIAAGFALFFGIYMFNMFSGPTYSDFADHDNISLVVRGVQNELLTQAENAFNAKKFSEAEVYFTKLLENESTNKEIQLYKGVTLVELNKFDEADALFGELSKGSSAYKDKAVWYLALSKLKQKDNEACAAILRTVLIDSEDYEQAQKLLEKLD